MSICSPCFNSFKQNSADNRRPERGKSKLYLILYVHFSSSAKAKLAVGTTLCYFVVTFIVAKIPAMMLKTSLILISICTYILLLPGVIDTSVLLTVYNKP